MGQVLVRASQIFLLKTMEQGMKYHYQCTKGLPPGAKFLYMFQNGTYDTNIVVEHPDFPELKIGDVIPDFKLEYERIE
jgi:hypothetical protein